MLASVFWPQPQPSGFHPGLPSLCPMLQIDLDLPLGHLSSLRLPVSLSIVVSV